MFTREVIWFVSIGLRTRRGNQSIEVKGTAVLRACILFASLFFLFVSHIAVADDEIILPEPKLRGKMSLEEAIYSRHGTREFENKALSLEEISQLL